MRPKGIIYKATNKINGKIYIGKTFCGINSRKIQHISNAFNQRHSAYNTKFYRAIRKYGKSNFHWEVLENNIINSEINKYEKNYIKKFNSFKKGYNSTLGGEGTLGLRHADEVKKHISKCSSARNKGKNNPRFGKAVSPETRKKISDSKRGKKLSDMHKIKTSATLKGRKFNISTKQKMVKSANGKPIEVYKDNNLVYTFYGQRECSRVLDLNRKMLRKSIKNKTKYKGYIFKYKGER